MDFTEGAASRGGQPGVSPCPRPSSTWALPGPAGARVRLLDLVWPVMREQGVRTGHSVVVYHPGTGGEFSVDVGVGTFTRFASCGEVRRAATPAGEAVTVTHHGEHSGLAPAYAALEQWCADNERRPAGVTWEVYGDWDEDPGKRRTDVFMLLESVPG